MFDFLKKGATPEAPPPAPQSTVPVFPASNPPSSEECDIMRTNLFFVISNLKYSLVHHKARTDGTMDTAWNEERDLLKKHIQILQKYKPEEEKYDTPVRRQLEEDYTNQLEEVEGMIELSQDPTEKQRLEGMKQMHLKFVRALESLLPLFHQVCPPTTDMETYLDQHEKKLIQQESLRKPSQSPAQSAIKNL